VVFNNLHFQLRDLSIVEKLKNEDLGKEIKFCGTLMLDIILRHWFLINLNFQLPKSKDKDENTSSIESDFNINCQGLEPSLRAS
jgi:hypothetical protein